MMSDVREVANAPGMVEGVWPIARGEGNRLRRTFRLGRTSLSQLIPADFGVCQVLQSTPAMDSWTPPSFPSGSFATLASDPSKSKCELWTLPGRGEG